MKGTLKKIDGFSKAVFHGFVLKPGYYFGTDDKGNPVATSSHVKNGMLCLYTKVGLGNWNRIWLSVDDAKKKFVGLDL